MAYRTILVDCTDDGPIEERLHVARSLAARFDAVLVGLHASPPLPTELAAWQGGWSVHTPPELVEAQRTANQEATERARAAFERACGGSAASWREAEDQPGRSLAAAARASDLVVAARGGVLELVEQVVADAGVPVLALPPHASGGDPGRTVLVAWDGSREATRAAHDALPFLRAAERVVLCAVGETPAASLDDAAAMLRRHGAPVEPEQVDGADKDAGELLLARAGEHGADLLVMGAYGHSRLREFVLGGATRHALRHAPLPVLFGS